MNGICDKTSLGYISIEEESGFVTGLFLEQREYSPVVSKVLNEAKKQIQEYLKGKRTVFDFSMQLFGTHFQKQVWDELLKIGYGKTVAYSDIAKGIGNPKAVRAVGHAIGQNPIAIVIPCHRVIGKNGKLTGYFYGTEIKQKLLNLEQNHVF